MADRIVVNRSDRLLRAGFDASEIMRFLQMDSFDVCKWEDDFMSGVLTASVYTSVASAGATAFAVLAPTATANEWGVIRGVTGTTDNESVEFSLARQCRGEYNAVMAVRYRVSAITGLKIEIGFRDTVADATAIVNAINTPTFNATDGTCWIFDTDGTTARWQAHGVSNTTAATGVVVASGSPGEAPVADTYQTMLVALLEGDAFFERFNADGAKQGATERVASSQRAGQNLAPAVYVQTRNTTSKNFDVDFFKVWQLRRS